MYVPTIALTLSVPQDFHGCTKPFFIYAQNIMVYNLTAHNYVSLKDNPNKVYIKLKGIGYTICKCKVKSFESRFLCFRKDRRKKKKKVKNFFKFSFILPWHNIVIIYSRNLIFQQHAGNFMVNKYSKF